METSMIILECFVAPNRQMAGTPVPLQGLALCITASPASILAALLCMGRSREMSKTGT